MKPVSGLLVFLFTSACYADHLDVLVFDLQDGCTVPEYMAIVEDFNAWGKDYDYRTEVAVPLQSDDLSTLYWMGRSPNAAAFGRAWDSWRDAQSDSSSVPARLQARFNECANPNSARRGYDVY
jgi:hypothetical protein